VERITDIAYKIEKGECNGLSAIYYRVRNYFIFWLLVGKPTSKVTEK